MIIKGNSVGHPLPDPRKGLEMQGGINMNGQKLNGIAAPEADDEAANKGYVDANKVDKSRVVNNFTTTEEGFVADARALKLLNDSRLSTELLWRNASPNSEFGVQGIAADTQKYDAVIAKFRYASSDFFDPYPQTSVLCFMYHYAIGTSAYAVTDSAGIVYRIFDVYDGGVWFREGHEVNTGECHNQYCIPTELYGVKFFGGVSV